MLLLKAILLGVIQGLTEFVPVSSSAHLIIVPWAFGWKDQALESLSFDVALHLGTLTALLVFFASDWVRIIKGGVMSVVERRIGEDLDRRMAWFLVIGSIPGGIVGLLLESRIDRWFHPPSGEIQAGMMIVLALVIAGLGVLLFLAERLARHVREMKQLTIKDTMLIGLAQSLAVFPGVSRSGSTITAGLALGLNRETAAKFSFLLSAPIIAGAGLKSLWKIYAEIRSGLMGNSDVILFLVGFLVAAFSGYLSIKYVLRFLQKHPATSFVYYRWALAVVVFLVALVRG